MKGKKQEFNWDVCGHRKNVDFLQLSIRNNHITHAYLFFGSSGLGKSTLAREFISSVFCQDRGDSIPCGECIHCQQLKNGVHPDVYFVSRGTDEKTGKLKKNISVEQIRELKDKLQQGTLLNSYKAAIVPQAEFMNISGANALLKMLEEPTPNTVIILITNDINKIPETIVSRCQSIRFLPVAREEIETYIKKIDPQSDSKSISRLAYGRPGAAIDFLNNPEKLDVYKHDIHRFFEIISKDTGQRLSLVDELIDWKKDEVLNISRVGDLLSHWQTILRDLILAKNDNGPLVANAEFLTGIENNRNQISNQKIRKIVSMINQSEYYFARNVNSRTVLENLVINI